VGYAQADASATVDLKTGTEINTEGEVLIATSGSATASIGTETKRKLGNAPSNPKSLALSLGVANTDAIANTFVAEGVIITAGKTANIVATGTSETDVETEASLYADGRAGLASGLGFSDADIRAEVNGTVTANVDPDGSTVKLEFDPTVTDASKIGYVDTANKTINVGPNALVKGDKVNYTNRRGTSIGGIGTGQVTGGLVDGKDYYVIPVPNKPNLIQLAETEKDALEDKAISLSSGATTPKLSILLKRLMMKRRMKKMMKRTKLLWLIQPFQEVALIFRC
jgi:flagellar basal body rod protein FlgC